MVPPEGFEPTTFNLKGSCSCSAELRRRCSIAWIPCHRFLSLRSRMVSDVPSLPMRSQSMAIGAKETKIRFVVVIWVTVDVI